ncbi:MAG: RloB domain-containing protein [Candidatus Aminicenantes bacterium]|nr:MAG: RloB domain-containing protein [Candidatus Aminicenantes bacterium]
MPRNRSRRSGKRKVNKRLFIVCEGKKTEPNYFNKFIEDCNFRGKPVEVQVVKIKKNTARELVDKADVVREIPGDEVWAVFDKNGYTKHNEAFKKVKNKHVKIAFSSISFEYWILLHFEYTTRSFINSEKIIDYLKSKSYIDYKKSDETVYDSIKNRTVTAAANARKVRKYQSEANPNHEIFNLNPYTNVDELLEAIKKIREIYK